MKQKNMIRTILCASVCGLLTYACTGSQEELEWPNATPQNADSRTAEPVTANLILTETGTLDAKLTEKLGEKKLTVQELTLAGPFSAKDVETLHTLKALEKLDLTDLKIINEGSYYSFSYSYEENGNTSDHYILEWLPENTIGNYMFAGMPSLKDVTMPASVQAFNSFIFQHTGLTTVTLPEGITTVSGFHYCTTLKTVNLPSTLTEIGYEAFRNCTALENFTIPKNVKNIGQWAFAETRFTSIELPSTLTTIGSYAFYSTQLKEIEIPSSVTTLGYSIFGNCDQLKILTIPKAVTQIEDSPTSGCNNLQALIWNSLVPVPDNPSISSRCYLYINSNNEETATYNTDLWKYVIIDGEAESIQLNLTDSWNPTKYSCPIAFKAKSISLTIPFSGKWTYEGKAAGWRTIVLPFDVTSVTSEEKGALAAFGSEVEGAKPFWLRRLTAKGFVDVTAIKADTPYIIAMPYNPNVYLDEYNITGNVTFTGENVEIAATPDVLPADEGPEYYLQPTYQYVKRGGYIYALNYDYYIRNYEYGSVFARSSANVYTYEAYLKPKSPTDTRALYGIDARSSNTRTAGRKNTTGVPAIGDM